MNNKKRLNLKGKTAVLIDWANVYGWQTSLKKMINPVNLLDYFKQYPKVIDIRLYFGRDNHEKSIEFLREIEQDGFTVITKPVKHILVAEIEKQRVYRRKCDFDMEICIDVHRLIKQGIDSFIFLTGDGDFEPLYKLLRKLYKQVIVVYTKGHLGREIWQLQQGIFKIELKNLMEI